MNGTLLKGDGRENLRQDLLGIGFDDVRFSDIGPVHDTGLPEWLERGWHADMDWMSRTSDKRLNPGLVLPGVGSLVLFGVNYLPAEQAAADQQRWARYALYEDYHDTIVRALREAASRICDRLGLNPEDCRGYADTGPVMERGFASRSGMGWLGKNGMLISRIHGNWLFLAAVLVRARIEPDPLLAGGRDLPGGPPSLGRFCGKCVSCMTACPTDAIRKPGMIDSRRCISYQTIENKGVIPRKFRAAIGSRIFGCDICLDVCPWNRFARAGRSLLLASRYDLADLDLVDILAMTPQRFAEVFRRTPLKRLKLERLLRNACIVAGNLDATDGWKDHAGPSRSALIILLVRLAGHGSDLVRVHAVWAVYRLEPVSAVMRLSGARDRETDADVLEEYAFWDGRTERTR